MLPVPEREEVERGVHELVLQRILDAALAHPCEPERVEDVRLRVTRVVRVRRHGRGGDERALWDARPVRERDVLDGLAEEVYWRGR